MTRLYGVNRKGKNEWMAEAARNDRKAGRESEPAQRAVLVFFYHRVCANVAETARRDDVSDTPK
jgi:hypothetical protein